MKRYFWREKNAYSCAESGQVIDPTREELEQELVLKLVQKLNRSTLIFDKQARTNYLANQTQSRIKIENLSEEEIQREVGKNVIVDFVQVLMDLSQGSQKMTKEEVYAKIKRSIDNLLLKKKVKQSIEQIYLANIALADLLKLNLADIEKQRAFIEQSEGNFFKGKYVVFKE